MIEGYSTVQYGAPRREIRRSGGSPPPGRGLPHSRRCVAGDKARQMICTVQNSIGAAARFTWGGIALLLSCTCLVSLNRVACKGVSPFRSLSECQILPCPESYVLRTPNCYIRLTPEALSRIACNSINSRRNSKHVLTIGGGRGLCYCRDRRRSSASSSIDTRRVHVAVLWVFIRTTHHLWADCAYYRIHISYNKVF